MVSRARRAQRRLTKPQRARAERLFARAVDGAGASLGRRLLERHDTMRGGEPTRWFAMAELVDADVTYTIWLWAERHSPSIDSVNPPDITCGV